MTPEADPPLLPVEPSYRHVLRVGLVLSWLPLVIGAIIADAALLEGTPFRGVPSVVVTLIAISAIVFIPQRTYRRLGYRLTERMLQSVHGWMFHTDTLVPFVRVQHLDVKRGPLDKFFGTASLVVHTAGTHNSIVTVNGLSPDRAAEFRDIIREHVRSDFA
jgi:membrane protein YdbS with pleckstrin-like domain